MLPTIFIPFHVFIFVRDCVKRHMCGLYSFSDMKKPGKMRVRLCFMVMPPSSFYTYIPTQLC